jgi:hypothetical protein
VTGESIHWMLASSTRISLALRQRSLTCCSDIGWLRQASNWISSRVWLAG